MKFLGEKYNKKSFEHIGAKVDYLAALYKLTPEEKKKRLTKLKGMENRSLNNLSGFIDRHGEVEGQKRFNIYCKKIREKGLGWEKSKVSQEFTQCLKESGLEFDIEYFFEKEKSNRRVDFYVKKYNLHIEFFGDYWHANPVFYKREQVINFPGERRVIAKKIWESDAKRVEDIKKQGNILVVWENTWKTNKKEISSFLAYIKKKVKPKKKGEIFYV